MLTSNPGLAGKLSAVSLEGWMMIFVPVLTPEASATSNTPELRGRGGSESIHSPDKARVAPGLRIERSQSLAASEPSCNPFPQGQWCWGWGAGSLLMSTTSGPQVPVTELAAPHSRPPPVRPPRSRAPAGCCLWRAGARGLEWRGALLSSHIPSDLAPLSWNKTEISVLMRDTGCAPAGWECRFRNEVWVFRKTHS